MGTFHRPQVTNGHSNVPMIFVRCIILFAYNETQLIPTYGKKYWKDSGRGFRVQGGAKHQLQESRNRIILGSIGTDSGDLMLSGWFCFDLLDLLSCLSSAFWHAGEFSMPRSRGGVYMMPSSV